MNNNTFVYDNIGCTTMAIRQLSKSGIVKPLSFGKQSHMVRKYNYIKFFFLFNLRFKSQFTIFQLKLISKLFFTCLLDVVCI